MVTFPWEVPDCPSFGSQPPHMLHLLSGWESVLIQGFLSYRHLQKYLDRNCWTQRSMAVRFQALGSPEMGIWLESPNTLATSCKELTHWKRPWCWEGLEAGGEGDDRGWDGWMASLTRWTWVWVNSWSWWLTGGPGMLRFMGLQRVRHDWATELNWAEDAFGVVVLRQHPTGILLSFAHCKIISVLYPSW